MECSETFAVSYFCNELSWVFKLTLQLATVTCSDVPLFMPKTRPKISSVKKKSTAGKKACTICGDHFRPQRFSAHLRKCEREKKDAKDKLEYEKELLSKTLAGV